MWALLKLYVGFLAIGLEMIVHLPYALVFWSGRLLGQGTWVDDQVDRMVSAWARRCLTYLQTRVNVEGLEHLPPQGAVILMSNHQSLLDIPVCLGFLGRTMGFVAKKELFRIPALSFWMRQIHCANMDRADIRSSGKLLEDISRQVQEGGYRFLIFPEGTRTRDPNGELGPFRRGALRLAEAQGIPIVPVSLDGTRFLVKLRTLRTIPPSRRVVRVRIAPPVPVPKDQTAPQSKRLMEQLRETVYSNWQAIRLDWTANPVREDPTSR